MLSSTLFKAFATPITYTLIIILLVTAVMQVRYVNKALQRFDSTQVIPIQFVLFTLSVIIGSAVLYRDFERTTATQAAKFVGGCLLTFFGVILITSGRPPQDDEDQLSDDENVEETIRLRHQEAAGMLDQSGEESRHQGQEPTSISSSRRSSFGSRISFASTTTKHTPSRDPRATISRTFPLTPSEESPLLANPWTRSADSLQHPRLPHTVSNDSVATIQSMPSVAATEPVQAVSDCISPTQEEPPLERPITPPRHSMTDPRPLSRHFNNTFISPSPLSSTVSAVVSDALSGREGSISRRPSIRRMRRSLRASLGITYDEDDPDSVAGPLLPANRGREPPANQDENLPPHRKSTRRRAHSLSNTLEEFFGRKRKRRRNTITESQGTEDQTPDPSVQS